jgi:hypothetical protein
MHRDGILYQRTEVRGLFGIPDLLAVQAPRPLAKRRTALNSIAFEMKLSDWRRGLAQAFRYRSFATFSILVLDNTRTKSAVANADRFRRANIGLIGLNVDGSYDVYVWPEPEKPFSKRLHAAMAEIVRTETSATDHSPESDPDPLWANSAG